MAKNNQAVGKYGEKLAESYLVDKGYIFLERNVRTKFGEIDLVMQLDTQVVFVEVKTRRTLAYGFPETGITATKANHMRNAALAYLQIHPELGEHWRIDVVAVYHPVPGNQEIVHFENALS